MNPINKIGLIEAIKNELGVIVSESTIDKDIDTLRNDSDFGFSVPIKSICGGSSRVFGYYFESDWSLSDEIKKAWRI